MKPMQKLHELPHLFNQLILYRSLKQDPAINELLQIIDDIEELADLFLLSGWVGALLEQFPTATNPWVDYLTDLVISNENYFSLACEKGEYPKLPVNILTAAQADLKTLAQLMSWNPSQLILGAANLRDESFILHLESPFHCFNLKDLAGVYKKGSGLFGKYASFVWQGEEQWLRPVATPDPVTLNDLIGIEIQKNILIQNTIQFIKGYPANNVLLYGDRGTGKSSSIKALGNWFVAAGLRMIEVTKDDLVDFPAIMNFLRQRGLKFILYVDDLSFEPNEISYKHLKAILEGGLELKPPNVLIYATSNRRHLIKETFVEREDDLHSNDAIQERLSLADRFGITLTFTTPNQAEYLAIVNGLAEQHSFKLQHEELERRALQWAMQHNGRSGRTAKQFIDQLHGELGVKD